MIIDTETDTRPTTAATTGVNSWDEFTALREIVVGDATHARLPQQDDPSAWLSCFPQLTRAELGRIAAGEMPSQVVEETNEDLAVLCASLRGLGVTVHQPAVVDHRVEFASPHWRSAGFTSYCPRDLTLVVGSTIIETASPTRSRYFEVFGLRPLFQDYLRRGATLAGRAPPTTDRRAVPGRPGRPAGPGGQRAGLRRRQRAPPRPRPLLPGVAQRQRTRPALAGIGLRLLGDIRVHPLRGIYGYTHIDSTIALLRPGLVLLNPGRMRTGGDTGPTSGLGRAVVPADGRRPAAGPPTLSEHWVSMNLLMVDAEHGHRRRRPAGTDRRARTARDHRATAPAAPRQLLGGGFHCVTLDTVRAGGPENYLD